MSRILRYVSDLHLELRGNELPNKLKYLWDFNTSNNTKYYLALVGDIGNTIHNGLDMLFNKISPKYEHIYYIPGNHEYYDLSGICNFPNSNGRSLDLIKSELRDLHAKYPNISLLDNSVEYIEGIKIIGSTLWSHVPDEYVDNISIALNDYHLIKKTDHTGKLVNITIDDTNKWNKECIEFLKREIDTSDKCIVLTHHAPLFSDDDTNQYTADPKYLESDNNSAFHNNLGHMIKRPIYAWIYGHTHYASKFKFNNVIVATNQLGYNFEESIINFNENASINLDKIIYS